MIMMLYGAQLSAAIKLNIGPAVILDRVNYELSSFFAFFLFNKEQERCLSLCIRENQFYVEPTI
jgi:hypothetical protein